MKDLRHSPISCLLALTLFFAAASTFANIRLQPVSPNERDSVEVIVRGDWQHACVPRLHSLLIEPPLETPPTDSFSTSHNDIEVYLESRLDESCVPTATPFEVRVTLGRLPVGSYTVQVFTLEQAIAEPPATAVPADRLDFSVTSTARPFVDVGNRRFRAQSTWQEPEGPRGTAHATPGSSDDSGIFWFFDPTNWELMVKVLDGCAINDHYWVLGSASTHVGFDLTVTDRLQGEIWRFSNPVGQRAGAFFDTTAFPCQAIISPCGRGSSAEILATPRSDRNVEDLALSLSTGIAADEAIYQRLTKDLGAIRRTAPEANAITFQPTVDNSSLGFSLEGSTLPEWDCLNAWYGAESITLSSLSEETLSGTIQFSGILDMVRVAPEYASLAGVRAAEPTGFVFIPESFPGQICVHREGDLWHYYLRQESDLVAPAPPLSLHFTTVSAEPDQFPEPLLHEEWDGTGKAPDWLEDFSACTKELDLLD